ncbi:VOC family protein [Brachybacterium sp. ACRRE]|uniref:VOC family protein n=1 Tax=Brachybacterium sp. ACRRE TaxID=2918184 RepID=UPI001EF1C1D3|nr:VOC family protein [Brachybacterium sp. ACRRE]MCG7308087.1 VOC family protein [Brachybacterium sp. ACRRE]
MFEGLLGQCAVTDVDRAEEWFTILCGRPPDARPMAGLLEWHLGPGFGLQVWSEAESAGHSTVSLVVTDIDADAERLLARGIAHDGPQPGGGARILVLADPDGNRVVLTGS